MGGCSTARACLLVLAATACVLALLTSAEAAGAEYIPVDIGYPFGYAVGSVNAVNDAGQIVGSGTTSYAGAGAMSWTQAVGFSSNPVTERASRRHTAVPVPTPFLAGTTCVRGNERR
jgi:hypothetical protein